MGASSYSRMTPEQKKKMKDASMKLDKAKPTKAVVPKGKKKVK